MKCRSSSKKFVLGCTILVVIGLVRSHFIQSNDGKAPKKIYRDQSLYTNYNSYGATIKSSIMPVPGGVLEKVALFPQKDSCCKEQCFERHGALIRYHFFMTS